MDTPKPYYCSKTVDRSPETPDFRVRDALDDESSEAPTEIDVESI